MGLIEYYSGKLGKFYGARVVEIDNTPPPPNRAQRRAMKRKKHA